MTEHYEAVLADLQERRWKLGTELREIDVMISGLKRLLGKTRPHILAASAQPSSSAIDLAQAINRLPGENLALHESPLRFSNIPLQWSVIWYLAEDAEGSAKTADIANALLAGGCRGQGEFGGPFFYAVWAVLNEMKTQGEVDINDGAEYRLTDAGKQRWESIRQSAEFQQANELLLLAAH